MQREVVQGITLDGCSTRDIDDAFWVERLGDNKGWRVWISIADVSETVKPSSAEDKEAREKVATRYFATGNSPMLPRTLSEGSLSLRPNQTCKTVTLEFTVNEEGSPTSFRPYLSELTSKAKLAYKDIPAIRKDPKHRWHSIIDEVVNLTNYMLAARREGGAMMLYDLNNGWVSTEEGSLKQLKDKTETIGYIVIQELMVMTNTWLARYMVEHDIPSIYRNHVAKGSTPPREEFLSQIEAAMSRPMNIVAERQRLHMLLGRAEYDGNVVKGHYGLNLPVYTHFTSPIRRYADLVCQRQLTAHLKGLDLPYSVAELEAVASHINMVTAQELTRRSECEKTKAEKKARSVGEDVRRIDGLNAKDLERVIKVQIRSGAGPTQALVDAYKRRLTEGRVPTVCLALILLGSPEGDGWMPLRLSVLDYLQNHTHDVQTMLTYAASLFEWPPIQYESLTSGFYFVAPIIGPLRFDTKWPKANTIKEARNRSGLLLLWHKQGPTNAFLPEFEVKEEAPPPPPLKLVSQGDPVSELHLHCQANNLPPPTFIFTVKGAGHKPVVSCSCSLGEVHVEAKGTSKKTAKREAARQVLSSFQV